MAGCSSCAAKMARLKGTKYRWTSADGMDNVLYDTELQAKAKVIRFGGHYDPVDVPRK